MIIKSLAVAAALLSAGIASAAVTTINFNDGTAPGFSGDYTIFTTGVSNIAASVDGTSFLATPSAANSSGTATYTSAFAITGFAFDWGTPDAYNTLIFRDGTGTAVASYTGSIGGSGFAASYAFAAAANVRSVDFVSTNKAFEIDNLSVNAAVPEPATWGLMLIGFGFVGAAARRRAGMTVAA